MLGWLLAGSVFPSLRSLARLDEREVQVLRSVTVFERVALFHTTHLARNKSSFFPQLRNFVRRAGATCCDMVPTTLENTPST